MINQEIVGAPCKHGHIPFSCDRCTIEHLQKELATLKASLPKIKADAVREAIRYFETKIDKNHVDIHELEEYANKLEAGE